MFTSITALNTALQTWFAEHELEPIDQIDLLVNSALLGVGFSPVEKPIALGQTRWGGTPDLPAGLPWPMRPVPADKDTIAALGGSNHEKHIDKYLSEAFPYEFIAQIKCADVTPCLDDSTLLPTEGRLLFFYDKMVGPWRNGTASCRVLWDTSEAQALVNASLPEAFINMTKREEQEVLAGPDIDGLSKEELLSFVPTFKSPSRPMSVFTAYHLPSYSSLEHQQNSFLQDIRLTQEGEEYDYAELLMDFDEHARQAHLVHQMFGAPKAEQDDPRYDAVDVTDEDIQQRRQAGEDWASLFVDIQTLSQDWYLLLQVGLSDLEQDTLCEGTIYFLMHREDLMNRQFEKAVAIYQQT